MLASGFWQSATSIVAQALENLDAEGRANGLLSLASTDRDDDSFSETSNNGMQNIRKELEEYKKLLDEAQMQHFELSKQSRLLIAEKDAEITFLKQATKQASSTVGETPEVHSAESNLLFQKLLSEKRVLESALMETEEQLRAILHEKNELNVIKKNYRELQERFEIVKTDLVSLKSEFETKEKHKNETIDNLVSEYSRLAAETELQQQKSSERVMSILRENEILVTKMHALEHSITELADRSVAAAVAPVASPSATSVMASPSPLTSSPPPSPMKGSKVADQSSDLQLQIDALNQNQKELRAKIVNLEFDLREKEKLIKQYEEQQQQRSLEVENKSKSDEKDGAILLLQKEIDGLKSEHRVVEQEKARLTDLIAAVKSEKTELEEQIQKLNRSLQDTNLALSRAVEESNEKTRVVVQDSEEEKKRLSTQIQQLEKSLSESETKCKELNEQIQLGDSAQDKVLQQVQQNLEALKQENAALQARFEDSLRKVQEQQNEIQNLVQARDKLVQEVREKDNLIATSKSEQDGALLRHQKGMELLKLKYEQELKELGDLSNKNASDQIAVYLQKIENLEAQKVSVEEEGNARLRKVEADCQSRIEELLKSTAQDKEGLKNQSEEAIALLKKEKEAYIDELKAQASKERAELESALESLKRQVVQLADDHQKELALKLASQSEELGKRHDEEVQTVLAEASKRHEEEKAKEISQLREELLRQHQIESDALKQDHVKDLATQLDQLKETQLKEKQSAIDALAASKEEEKTHALSELREAMLREQETAVKLVVEQGEQEKISLQQRLEESFKSRVSDLESQHQSVVSSLKEEISQLRSQLAEIESKHNEHIEKINQAKEKEKKEEIEKALAQLRSEMQHLINQANAERDEHLSNYTKERKLRKKIHNKLLELQGNIRVICRVRPILEVERRSGEDVDVTEILNDEELLVQRDAQTKSKFEYDRVFGQTSTQEEVFEAVQPLCVSVLDGYNVCIFAYGQTGSGKTYTMEGYGGNIGVSPRAINELFLQVESMKETATYTLSLSMLEIYNESIRDLLDSSHAKEKEKLDIRQTPEGNQVIGLTEISITSPEQVRDLMKLGQANRAVGSHDMNEHSSRSHSILTVTCRGINKLDNSTTFGKLHLIDLAGSERVGKTDATGERLKEAQNINKSLSCLGDVVNALGNKKATHVPYRNSKLTFLLQDSLGGNSKVLTFVNISPAIYNLGETICSLNFATRCRSTELGQAKRQTGTASSSSVGGTDNESVSSASSSKSLKKPLTSSASMASLTSPAIRK